ncbi:regulatory protein GemA [Denitromonas halophila]|uniref:Regulatory protein GemA n=1 Tax=Denitromonas halophila TaxID=1629404 RepID=A0A557QXB1_9RHOO|nr:regulatory protein GemA [Denitromonas halophila]TVO57552.1 regulatory protein GemA [Denitromonas halophila]
MTKNEAFERNGRIRAIKACQRDLDMDDDTYRALLRRVSLSRFGREIESCTQMPMTGLYAVLDELRRLGAHKKPAAGQHPGKPQTGRTGTADMIAKVEAQLADMKLPWAYAKAVLKRVSADKATGRAGVDRFEWATPTQLHKVIAALAYEQGKRDLAAAVRAELAEAGFAEADIPRLLPTYSGVHLDKWERNKTVMNRLRAAIRARVLAKGE